MSIGVGGALAAFIVWRGFTWLRAPPKLILSRDTTGFTEPLDANGNVDYAAIWRREHEGGVTAENNAAPLVYAALGWDLAPFTPEERAAAPTVPTPFVSFEDWGTEHRDAFASPKHPDGGAEREADVALESGDRESRQESAISHWFESIEPSLRVIREATARDRFHAPDAGPWTSRRLSLWALEDVAKSLAWSAMRHSSRSGHDSACSELCTLLRLARRVRSLGGNVLPFLVATSCEERVWKSVRTVVAKREGFTELEVTRIADARDPTSEEAQLGSLLAWDRVSFLTSLEHMGSPFSDQPQPLPFIPGHLDRNRINRKISDWTDRLDVAWMQEGDWPARVGRANALHSIAMEHRRFDRGAVLLGVLFGPDSMADAWGEVWASGLISTTTSSIRTLLTAAADGEIALVELAADVFASNSGHDPATSDDLTPRIFATPFRDRFTHSAVMFARDTGGRIVASGPIVELKRQLDAPKR